MIEEPEQVEKKLKTEVKLPSNILKEPPTIPDKPQDAKASCWAFYSKDLYKVSQLLYSECYTLPGTPKDVILWNGNNPDTYKSLDECLYYSLKKIYIMEKVKMDYDQWFELVVECLEE